MHRTLSDLTARIDRVLRDRVLPVVHTHRTPLEVTVVHLPGEPVPFAEAARLPFAPTAVGEPWGRAWSTSWFRLRGVVPPEMSGRRVEVLVDLGFRTGGPGFEAEGLVYTPDGVPLKGIEPRNLYVPVADPARGGEVVDLYVEAAANPSIGGSPTTDLGDLDTVPDVLLYRLARAEVAVLDEEVQALALDVQVLHELALQLPANDPRRERVRSGLERAVDALDVRDVPGTAAAARAELAELLASGRAERAPRVRRRARAHRLRLDVAGAGDRPQVRPHVLERRRARRRLPGPAVRLLLGAAVRVGPGAPPARVRPDPGEGRVGAVRPGRRHVGRVRHQPARRGEALARQLVQGRRYFARELGVEEQPEVWLPDSFGYTGAFPQLARLAGARWFLSQKMSWNTTNRFPHHTFWWEGIDGSRVFTHFPPADTYGAKLSGEQLAYGVANFADAGPANRSLLPFGYGDGGGGPTREMMETARRVADLEGSPRVVVETPAEFFAAAEAEYPQAPVWSGEMYLEFHRGTYTSQLAMKQGNRRTEHLLREAELWAATAAVRAGADYPYEHLDRLWQDTLLLQFHDILPGSSIAWVHREARDTYRRLAGELEALVGEALAAAAGPGDVEVLANAAPHDRAGVPALAAAVAAVPPGAVAVSREGDAVVLDNGVLRVRVDADGTIGSVRDLVADREVLAPGTSANVLQLHPDQPVRFDAWDVDEFYRHRVREVRSVTALDVDDADPARAEVRVTRHDGDSAYVQTIALAAGERRVDLALDVDWHERETLLKAAFPLAVHAERSTAETQFGHVDRATHTNTSWDAARFEICAHRWLHVAEPGYGVAVVNDSTYGHDVGRPGPGDARGAGATTVRLSLVRAPRYPDPETDQGRHTMRYALVPGAGIDEAVREGYRINLPDRRVRGAGPVEPLVAVEGAVVEAVKLADDRSGDVVVRLYEARGGRSRAVVRPGFACAGASVRDLLEREDPEVAALAPLADAGDGALTLDLGPFQVVTLRLTRA